MTLRRLHSWLPWMVWKPTEKDAARGEEHLHEVYTMFGRILIVECFTGVLNDFGGGIPILERFVNLYGYNGLSISHTHILYHSKDTFVTRMNVPFCFSSTHPNIWGSSAFC